MVFCDVAAMFQDLEVSLPFNTPSPGCAFVGAGKILVRSDNDSFVPVFNNFKLLHELD